MKTALITILVLLHALPKTKAQVPDLSGAPKAIQELAFGIQGKPAGEVRTAIIEKFGPGKAYKFTDSKAFPDRRVAQHGNFFLEHPNGTVEVSYTTPVAAETLLESVPEGSTIAHLVFTSVDHKHEATFPITSSGRERRLSFAGKTPLTFQMEASWKNFWR